MPLDSVDQDSDDAGAESAAVQSLQCSALLGSPGWGKNLEPVSEGQGSRKGWMGGNYLLNTDPARGCRHHGRLDMLQALPVDCKVAARLILRDRYLHSVLWNETGDTSSLRGSQGTEERP